jgi:hypothetical protein
VTERIERIASLVAPFHMSTLSTALTTFKSTHR